MRWLGAHQGGREGDVDGGLVERVEDELKAALQHVPAHALRLGRLAHQQQQLLQRTRSAGGVTATSVCAQHGGYLLMTMAVNAIIIYSDYRHLQG